MAASLPAPRSFVRSSTILTTPRETALPSSEATVRKLYELDLSFNEDLWDEIESLVMGLFPVEPAMSRRQWIAIGHMAYGKARRIAEGDYDWPAEENTEDNASWIEDLETIAEVIFSEFQPGDAKF